MSNSDSPQEENINVNLDIDATIQKLSVKDGDVLVVQVPKWPTHIINMLQKQLTDQLQESGISVTVITMDKDVKLSVVSKEDQEND